MRKPGWIDRDDRDPVSLGGTVRLSDGRMVAVQMTDLSREGCRVRSDETLPIGDEVTIDVPPLANVSAKVRWSLQGITGLAFHSDWT